MHTTEFRARPMAGSNDLHLFADHGVQPQRLAMVGYGQFRPRESNDAPEGRNRNRRVMVIILADSAAAADLPASGNTTASTSDEDGNGGTTAASAVRSAVPAVIEGVQ